jgi:hypothetical protein
VNRRFGAKAQGDDLGLGHSFSLILMAVRQPALMTAASTG